MFFCLLSCRTVVTLIPASSPTESTTLAADTWSQDSSASTWNTASDAGCDDGVVVSGSTLHNPRAALSTPVPARTPTALSPAPGPAIGNTAIFVVVVDNRRSEQSDLCLFDYATVFFPFSALRSS